MSMGTQPSKPFSQVAPGEDDPRLRRSVFKPHLPSAGSGSPARELQHQQQLQQQQQLRQQQQAQSGRGRTTPTKNSWPCANCHATVSNQEQRCPYCGGIQVKVLRAPPSPIKGINQSLLLERLAATPTTPVVRRQIDATKITAFLNETTPTMSTNSSSMDYEDEEDGDLPDEQVVEKGERTTPVSPSLQLQRPQQDDSMQQDKQLPSSNTLRTVVESPAPSQESDQATALMSNASRSRPPDPVAVTLESKRNGTPSPALSTSPSRLMIDPQEKPVAVVTPKRKAGGAISPVQVPKKVLRSGTIE